jgi:hypothetical protein
MIIVCLSVSPQITFEPIKIKSECHDIEGNLDTIRSYLVASVIAKWWTFELLKWMQTLHRLTFEYEILYAVRSWKDE